MKLLDGNTPEVGAAMQLCAEIEVERGEPDEARELFLKLVDMDKNADMPEHLGGGAEKYLWLAQLSEHGGEESVAWFEQGATILRNRIAQLGDESGERAKRLAGALCGIVEVYMTDLSWRDDAEAKCERCIAEAFAVAPEEPETLQTLANIWISQGRVEEARKALKDSMTLWGELPSEAAGVPPFPTRISLARLLMEVEMEQDALEVLERLIREDDQSVEAWYLGGWCLNLVANKDEEEKQNDGNTNIDAGDDTAHAALIASREWLKQSLQLYDTLAYEDERLMAHAKELVDELNEELGPDTNAGEQADGDEWESEGEEDAEDEDTDMQNT